MTWLKETATRTTGLYLALFCPICAFSPTSIHVTRRTRYPVKRLTWQNTPIVCSGIFSFLYNGKSVAICPGEYVGDHPSWSPDHKFIAYISSPQCTPSEPEGIWICRADGTRRRRITWGNATKPAWSPDGKRLGFGRSQNRRSQVCVVDIATHKLTVLIDEPVRGHSLLDWASSVTFSPDGRRLVFSSQRSAHTKIWTCSSRGTERHLMPNQPAGDNDWPDWSPKGARILYRNQVNDWLNYLYTAKPDGSETKRFKLRQFEGPAAWSPDGKKIVYFRGVRGHLSAISIVNADGTGAHIVRGPGKTCDPDW